MKVLVLNPGSSSLKVSVLDSESLATFGQVEVSLGTDATQGRGVAGPVRAALKKLEATVPMASIEAVGYRVVHGGTQFRKAVRITPLVVKGIEALAEFAPLHNPVAAATIRATQAILKKPTHVATFDTAFHATLPEVAYLYPVPARWSRDWKVRRFGFHGLSAEWSTRRAAELLAQPAEELALIVAHLGSGASVTAVLNGQSVDTSMGLTPLEGLMMGTRAGSIDPGILTFALRTKRSTAARLEDQLWHESGLVGVAGKKAGMRELEEAARKGNKRAQLAVDMFVNRASAGIAAMATSLPRIDALVFTGGIGEHSASIRSGIARRLGALGFSGIKAGDGNDDEVLTESGWRPAVLRVAAREDAIIAGQIAELLSTQTRRR
ncbi:MAG: acetate/propionate family kinase [Candidatus Dormibacteraeota bacterium]|nr:acetate/propionate family kinase [Candidatus Dormibacteraeota bacterium]